MSANIHEYEVFPFFDTLRTEHYLQHYSTVDNKAYIINGISACITIIIIAVPNLYAFYVSALIVNRVCLL